MSSNKRLLEHHAVWAKRSHSDQVKCLANKVTFTRAADMARRYLGIGNDKPVPWQELAEPSCWVLHHPTNGTAYIGPADPAYPSERELNRQQKEQDAAKTAAWVARQQETLNTARGVATPPGQPLQTPSAERREAICKGCGRPFHPTWPNQLYHDGVCKARYRLKQEQRKQP